MFLFLLLVHSEITIPTHIAWGFSRSSLTTISMIRHVLVSDLLYVIIVTMFFSRNLNKREDIKSNLRLFRLYLW